MDSKKFYFIVDALRYDTRIAEIGTGYIRVKLTNTDCNKGIVGIDIASKLYDIGYKRTAISSGYAIFSMNDMPTVIIE